MQNLSTKNHTLLKFPYEQELYQHDIAQIAYQAQKRYGKQEWRAIVLATEMHNHLGIYTTIGAKMGIFAMEYLATQEGTLRVVSWAGSNPPVSCFTDGLQCSTAATLGHGLIEVLHPLQGLPMAEFSFQNKHLRLCLKEDLRALISREITLLKAQCTTEEEYFSRLRQLALGYWLEWDRKEMFDIKP